MVFLTAVLAAPPVDTSHSADVDQTGAEAPVSQEPTGSAYTQALTRLDDRVAAVEAATVTLVGHPLVDTTKAASRTLFRPDLVDATAAPVTSGLTAEQLPDRVLGARQQVASGDVAAAARVVEGVETDVLLVALDLGDQSAQNAAMTRLLVSADPQVALLDAAVGATHAAAEVRDVVAAATSAVQARDAAAGITVAAQQIAVTGDEDAKAAVAKVEAAGPVDRRLHQRGHPAEGALRGRVRAEPAPALRRGGGAGAAERGLPRGLRPRPEDLGLVPHARRSRSAPGRPRGPWPRCPARPTTAGAWRSTSTRPTATGPRSTPGSRPTR